MRREIHNLSMLTFPYTSTTRRKASASSESQPSSSGAKTQHNEFSQIPKILRARFRCMTSFTSPGLISYLRFYFDICEWRNLPACAWTPALMLQLTNPCAKRKVLGLSKPKGKIYKTKSLGHYITVWVVSRCPYISKFSIPFSNPLVNVPSAPITISIAVTFMLYCFLVFCSFFSSRKKSHFSLYFKFTLWSARMAKLTIRQILFFFLFDYYLIWLSCWN